MIDLHSHILPGLDDGAADLKEALTMAGIAVADGIKTMVATPHVETGLYDNSRETILAAVDELRGHLQENNIPLELLPGAEYHLEPDLPGRLQRGELLTINDGGRYLLVELPAALVPEYTARVFYELQLQGVTPIIAHPERNLALTNHPSIFYELVARGAVAQLTAASFTGGSRRAAAAARAFLAKGCVHLVATDAHNSNKRPPHLAEAGQQVAKLAGEARSVELVSGNPLRVLQGGVLETGKIEYPRQSRRSLLQRLKQLVSRRS
jgi:protein-tyrosine phosphatase